MDGRDPVLQLRLAAGLQGDGQTADGEGSMVKQQVSVCLSVDGLIGMGIKGNVTGNSFRGQMTFELFFLFFSYLEEKSVSQGVAETEHKVLLGMLWNSLNNAALHPDRVLWSAVVVDSRTAVRLIEEQSATLGGKRKKNKTLSYSTAQARPVPEV